MASIYATAVFYQDSGILIRGPSGSGKSDLAIRLIEDGANLIADDYVRIDTAGNKILLSPPKNIAGLIEVRGIGIINMESIKDVPLRVIFDLKPTSSINRMPENLTEIIEGISIPVVEISAFECSVLSKIKIFLRTMK